MFLIYSCRRQIPNALGWRDYLSVQWEEGALCVERQVLFRLPCPHPPKVPTSMIISVTVLSGEWISSKMSQSPNLHIMTQLLTLKKKWNNFFLSRGDHSGVYLHPNETGTKFNNFFAKIGCGTQYHAHSSIIQTEFS